MLNISKKNEIILDIKFNYLNKEKNDIKYFLSQIIEEIEQNKMLNSVIFNDNLDLKIISQLKNLRINTTISISPISK